MDDRREAQPGADDPYAASKKSAQRIEECFDALAAACDDHVKLLNDLIVREEGKPEPNTALLGRLKLNARLASELLEVVDTTTHDGLIRAVDRLILIKVAAEGRFV